MKRQGYGRLLLLLIGAALYAIALLFCQRTEEGMGLTQVLLERAIDSTEAERIGDTEAEEEDPIRFCFWGETGEETPFCPVNGAQARGRMTLLAGHPALMEAESLTWQKGCLMDAGTARTLFGTDQCGGQRVTISGREYPVLGTVSGSLPRLLRLAEKKDGSVLDRCVLSLAPEQGRTQGEAFLMRHGLQGKILDYFPTWAVTKNLLLFFPGLLFLTAWGKLRRGWRRLSLSGIRGGEQTTLLLKTILSLTLTLGTVWLLGKQITIPSDMIPSRWSDFSFWGNWWRGQKENFSLLFSVSLGSEQLQMAGNMVKSMVASTAAFLLALWAVRRENHENPAD